jgi:hypothetical protein
LWERLEQGGCENHASYSLESLKYKISQEFRIQFKEKWREIKEKMRKS